MKTPVALDIFSIMLHLIALDSTAGTNRLDLSFKNSLNKLHLFYSLHLLRAEFRDQAIHFAKGLSMEQHVLM